MKNKFLDRFNEVLHERRPHPWGDAVGVGRGTIDRILKGNIPTGDALSAISRVENVSLTWLLEGRGTPYMVASPADDAEACDLLEELLLEGGWSAHVLSNVDAHVIVLTKPGSFQHKGKPEVHYTIVEIIAGQFGQETLILLKLGQCVSRCQLQVSRDVIKRLRQGRMSNMELIGWKDQPGILAECPRLDTPQKPNNATKASAKAALVKGYRVAEHGSAGDIGHNVRQLRAEHQRVAKATIRALLEIEGKEWKDADG